MLAESGSEDRRRNRKTMKLMLTTWDLLFMIACFLADYH